MSITLYHALFLENCNSILSTFTWLLVTTRNWTKTNWAEAPPYKLRIRSVDSISNDFRGNSKTYYLSLFCSRAVNLILFVLNRLKTNPKENASSCVARGVPNSFLEIWRPRFQKIRFLNIIKWEWVFSSRGFHWIEFVSFVNWVCHTYQLLKL